MRIAGSPRFTVVGYENGKLGRTNTGLSVTVFFSFHCLSQAHVKTDTHGQEHDREGKAC